MQQSSTNCFMLLSKSFFTSLFNGSVAILLIVSDQLLFGNLLFPGLFSMPCAALLVALFFAPAGRPGPFETGAEADTTLCQAKIAAAIAGSGIVVADTGASVRAKASSLVF